MQIIKAFAVKITFLGTDTKISHPGQHFPEPFKQVGDSWKCKVDKHLPIRFILGTQVSPLDLGKAMWTTRLPGTCVRLRAGGASLLVSRSNERRTRSLTKMEKKHR